MSRIPVAQRMSWAARRTTSRTEDQAYCLLGILDVNMPLLYGEGVGAFSRLQQEILHVHDDSSIFLWSEESYTYGLIKPAMMLAPHVSCLSGSGNIAFISSFSTSQKSPRFSLTNRGVRVRGSTLRLSYESSSSSDWAYLLPLMKLTQWQTRDDDKFAITRTGHIYLKLLKTSAGTYIRLPGWSTANNSEHIGVVDVVSPEEDFHILNSGHVA